MPENFHFLQPLWLLALIPLAALAWRAVRPGSGENPWRRVVDARLLPLLLAGRAQSARRGAFPLLAAGWVIAALALADPAWQREPQPVYQTTAARVIVLELARSMDADDLKPSRLVRARYKVEDALAQSGEGQTGLVVYSGAAFTVTPLTRDVNTIRAMLPDLDPAIMPAPGSRADLGLLRADRLLSRAGASSGQVLLIADGIGAHDAAASERAAARLKSDGYRVSVLGVGTGQSATLQAVARAGGGAYRLISDDGEALRALLARPLNARTTRQASATAPAWQGQGPLLVLLLLPLAALAFRRNWLLSLALLAGFASPPRPALASTWSDLWRRPDQQAAQALAAGDYARAAALATDAERRGSAEYKRGNYPLALDAFSRAHGADADYNRGNALARLGRYREAIAAYDKSLAENPADPDARANKAAVEAQLERRQRRQGQQQQPQQRQPQQQAKQQRSNSRNKPSQKKQGKSGQSTAQAGQARQAKSANRSARAAGKLAGQGARSAQRGAAANAKPKAQGAADDGAQPLDREQQLAAQQWLRRIPDDPGGLLRRKFLYQYRQRERDGDADVD